MKSMIFAEADRYASLTGDENDPSRLLHRCVVSFACHQWLKAQEPGTLPPERLLSLLEVKEGLEYLSGLPLTEQELATCRIYCYRHLYCWVIIRLPSKCSDPCLRKLSTNWNNTPKERQKQIQLNRIIPSATTKCLYTNLPDDYPSKKEWMRKGFPGLMELPGIKRICGELLPEMPQMADTLQGYMEQCDALIQYLK